MPQQVKVGEIIIGQYEVTELLARSSTYQWVKSRERKTGNISIIQLLLSNNIKTEEINDLFDYFDKLKNIRRKCLHVPHQIRSHTDFSLAVVYPDLLSTTLNLSESLDIELLIQSLYEASENLHALHNKDLIHGQINPEKFVLSGESVYLTGFGYAPLLAVGNVDAFKDCGDFLAPEVRDRNSRNSITTAIDIYAFAKTVAYWLPGIATSSWYLKATDPDPIQRFQRMRNLFQELKKAIIALFSSQTEVAKTSAVEEVETEKIISKPEPQSSCGLIPQYIIETEADPPEGGKVEGSGRYTEGKQIKIEAIAFPDWEFIGWDFIDWEGTVPQFENVINVVSAQNIKVIARFRKIPKSSVSIQIDIAPFEAQEFVKVSGAGNYTFGITINIHAWSIASNRWKFSHWEGDIKGLSNPLTISAETDKKIIAQFVIVPELDRPKPVSNEPGKAFASKTNQEDTQSNLPPKKQRKKSLGKALDASETEETKTEESTQNESHDKQRFHKLPGEAFASDETKKLQQTETPTQQVPKKRTGPAFDP